MSASGTACPSCGGKNAVRRDGRIVCSFCGSVIERRLLPGTLCEEDRGAAACGKPARSLCRRCSRPLCDGHDDPRSVYWGTPLGWERLFPRWTGPTAIAWARVQAPLQRFPVAGMERPDSPWVGHVQQSSYAVGQLEEAIRADLQAVAQEWAGEIGELACAIERVCASCERALGAALDEHVAAHAARYAQVAFLDRMTAFEAELRQRLQYIEHHLRRPVRAPPASEDDASSELEADSPRADWDRCGAALQARLRDLDVVRFASRTEG